MKELWYTTFVLLLIGILAGFSGLKPTAAVVLNLPPAWDLPTTEFSNKEPIELDLTRAFFDPDGDPLSFTVKPQEGLTASISGNKLHIDQTGKYTLVASDGRLIVEQEIYVTIE